MSFTEKAEVTYPKHLLHGLLAGLAAILLWVTFAKLDIVIVAEGRLVPTSAVKSVQAPQEGVVAEILVSEGEHVTTGQTLVKLDPLLVEADTKATKSELQYQRLQFRRVNKHLGNGDYGLESEDPADMYRLVEAQLHSDQLAHKSSLSEAQSQLALAKSELDSERAKLASLKDMSPYFAKRASMFKDLKEKAFVTDLEALEMRSKDEQHGHDLQSQTAIIQQAESKVRTSAAQLARFKSETRQTHMREANEIYARVQGLEQQLSKNSHIGRLTEIKATETGLVKQMLVRTVGSVVGVGTELMKIVPENDVLQAEVWIQNEDVGFVEAGQSVTVKVMAYPFQKYGTLNGLVKRISADTEALSAGDPAQRSADETRYKGIVQISPDLSSFIAENASLDPGMIVAAEIKQGRRTVMEYLLSPIVKSSREAARER